MTERPSRVEVAQDQTRGRFYVSCERCWGEPDQWCRWADSINAATDLTMQHVPYCPAVIAAADRLLDDILRIPTYRQLYMYVPGLGLIPLWGCTDCGRIAADQDEHTARHLDARERAGNQ